MASKTCIYCKEPMIYGPHRQIMRKAGKRISFVQYGWKCPMKNDDCDIVFEERDADRNKTIAANCK